MLTLHTVIQPYIKRRHNILDTLVFADLVLINSFSFHSSHHRKGANASSAIAQLLLIYLPLTVMGIWTLVTICRTVARRSCTRSLADATVALIPFEKASLVREFISKEADSSEEVTIHEQLSDSDEDMNHSVMYALKME